VAAISVRGLEAQQLEDLKNEAQRQGISLNGDNAAGTHDDLDALAGTWSQNEADAFNAAIAPLEQVDPELWE
jgi:hypothetical protein